MRWWDWLADLWRYWRTAHIPVKVAGVYVLLMSSIFFLIGINRPESDYRRLETQLHETRQAVRQFAREMTKRNGELNHLRGQNLIDRKTIDMLNRRIDDLYKAQVQANENAVFYRQILTDRESGKVIDIHGLEFNPAFDPQQWELTAILIRADRKKTFKGAYYFDIVRVENGSETAFRYPDENITFEMISYYEARNYIRLTEAQSLKNIRITVLDSKGNVVAMEELLTEDSDDNGNTTPLFLPNS